MRAAICATMRRTVMAVKIEGTCDPKFNRVKDAFAENFEKRSEVGAAASVMLDGKTVVDIWAGYADKARTRPRGAFLRSHRAGLPPVRKILDGDALFNWTTMTAALAEQEPWWVPGTTHGYHAVTFGWLVGEVIRRITGKTPGVYLRDEIAGPLGADIHIGLDAKHDARTADMIAAAPPAPGEPNLFADVM